MDSRSGWRGWLSGRPERAWPEGAVHHGVRLGLLLVVGIAVHLMFPVAPAPDVPVLEKGMVSDRDIIASVRFPIPKSTQELDQERNEAAASVPPFLDYDSSATAVMLQRVDGFFLRVDSAATSTRVPDDQRTRIRQVMRSYGLEPTNEAVDLLRSAEQRRLLKTSLDSAIRTALPKGIARTSDLSGGASGPNSAATQVRVRRGGTELRVSRDSVPTQAALFARAPSFLSSRAQPGAAELQRLILIRFFEPTLKLNREATEQAQARARAAVPTVKGEVLKGEKIIGAHEQVRAPELERLRAYREYLASVDRLAGGLGGVRALGSLLFDLTLLTIFGLLLYFFRPSVYGNIRHVLLMAALILALAGAAAVIGSNNLPNELIPVAIPALVVAALWDGRLALNLALMLAILMAGQSPFGGLSVLFTMTVGGAAAALSVRVVRRRAQTWVFVSIIAAAYAAAAITLGLLRSHGGTEVLWSIAWGAVNATASALVAMGFLPLLESFTRITTDQTLLELSDLNHPLLARLSREAPGTFSHSLSVANLAEAAARAIGANALLTRVGVYYHDVGKVAKPQYFIENQPPGRNPHDKLKPASSAAVVRNHVIEGLKLADEYKLPDCIRAFIAEHHGTQSISFFYDRAREEDPQAKLDPALFAYPGPRPQSKETAISMLADSVESAARVLPDPTPQRISELADRIVAAKMRASQLADAPLTLREISEIKEAFVAVLTGMYHQRIDYPTAPAPAPEPAPPAVAAAPSGQSPGR